MRCCQWTRYFCPQTRMIDGVQVKDVVGKHLADHIVIVSSLTILIFLGGLAMAVSPAPPLRLVGFIVAFPSIVCLVLVWWVHNRTFAEYKDVIEDRGYNEPPWYFIFAEDPILRCDAMVLLQHRLVNVQTLLSATRTLMVSTYKRTCPLYPMVRVDKKTLRAHLSTQLEYDLRTGKMYYDAIEAPNLNNSEAICQALFNDDGVSASASASLMHESKGPTHVISDASEDATMELDDLNEM